MYEFMNKKHVNGISYKPDHELMDEKKLVKFNSTLSNA